VTMAAAEPERGQSGRALGSAPGGVAGVPPLPAGFLIALDAGTKRLSDGSLFGGSPARVMRLTSAGTAALAELQSGPVRSRAAGQLARRLTDAGLAHPVPPGAASDGNQHGPGSVAVIIPVRDRAALLERCLAAAGAQYPVIVVDDGSADPEKISVIAAKHGATVRLRAANGGPAAARNTGLAGLDTDLIAFVDSDCVPPAGWIGTLAKHFADPLVGAVAPRIVPLGGPAATAAGRYATACSSLDLGQNPARVLPGGRVSYVPTAALVVRRAALDGLIAGRAAPFDPALRYGEDVDLIWRLHAAGWRIRYEPAVPVPHEGPANWPGLLARRFQYGTSAAPLAGRHPANMAPLALHPWSALTVAAALARRPAVAAAGLAGGWFELTAALRRAGVPADGSAAAAVTAARQTWLGIGRYATQFGAPAIALVLARPGGKSAARRWGRRAAAASLLLGPALDAYTERKPDLDPVSFTLARVADDICYGAGVWAGCLRERTLAPVKPVITGRLLRLSGQPGNGKD
jgi:mycofactocin glycosyltransferase